MIVIPPKERHDRSARPGRRSRGSDEPPTGHPAGDGDVRAGGRHVADERVDLGGHRGPRHHGERRPVGHRARGIGVGRVHPHQQQGRRPDRPQAGLRHRPVRLRRGCAGHDPRPERHRRHHLLGDHRRARRLAAPAGHAVAHPRQLHRRGPEAGLRPGRRGRRHRRRRRPAPRRIRHHLPVLAGRLRTRGGDHRGRARPDRPGPRRRLHRIPEDRPRRRGPLGPRHGRARARDPRVAGRRRDGRPPDGRRCRRPRVARLVARPPQARRPRDAHRSRPVPPSQLHRRHLGGDAAERRAWAAP